MGLTTAAEQKLLNDQHYEVPDEFDKLVLGPNLKYSWSLRAPRHYHAPPVIPNRFDAFMCPLPVGEEAGESLSCTIREVDSPVEVKQQCIVAKELRLSCNLNTFNTAVISILVYVKWKDYKILRTHHKNSFKNLRGKQYIANLR